MVLNEHVDFQNLKPCGCREKVFAIVQFVKNNGILDSASSRDGEWALNGDYSGY